MKYRKKASATTEANQFLKNGECVLGVRTEEDGRHYVMTIHEQKVYVVPGDWIAQEPDGVHYYPIKDSVFKAMYEKAE